MTHNNRIHALYAGFKSTMHGLNVIVLFTENDTLAYYYYMYY